MPLASRVHNLNQILYFGTGVATPIADGKGFSINMPVDFAEKSAWGESFKSYIPGMSDFKGQITKHYDHNEVSLRGAALAHTEGKFYWYPDRNIATDYVYWTGYVAMSGIDSGGLNTIIGQTYDITVGATQPTWKP